MPNLRDFHKKQFDGFLDERKISALHSAVSESSYLKEKSDTEQNDVSNAVEKSKPSDVQKNSSAEKPLQEERLEKTQTNNNDNEVKKTMNATLQPSQPENNSINPQESVINPDNVSKFPVEPTDANQNESPESNQRIETLKGKQFAVHKIQTNQTLKETVRKYVDNYMTPKERKPDFSAINIENRTSFSEEYPLFSTNMSTELQDILNIICARTNMRKYKLVEHLLIVALDKMDFPDGI